MASSSSLPPQSSPLWEWNNRFRQNPKTLTDVEFLVIIHQYDNDVSWALGLKCPFIVYTKGLPENEPWNAENKGKSETNLLKFCSEMYDQLPKNVVVVHQYNEKPPQHAGSLVDLLNDPRFKERYRDSLTPGFYNFNHYILGHIAPQVPKMLESGWWEGVMSQWFHPDPRAYGDFTLGKMGCSQFVVSRDRIQSLPREFYKQAYDWFLKNSISPAIAPGFDVWHCREKTPIDSDPRSDWHTSRYLEWTWELIFTATKPCEQPKIRSCSPFGALYGNEGGYLRDVSEHVGRHFLYQRTPSALSQSPFILFIPSSTQFNPLFGDTVSGTPKSLWIFVNRMPTTKGSNSTTRMYVLPEERTTDVAISF